MLWLLSCTWLLIILRQPFCLTLQLKFTIFGFGKVKILSSIVSFECAVSLRILLRVTRLLLNKCIHQIIKTLILVDTHLMIQIVLIFLLKIVSFILLFEIHIKIFVSEWFLNGCIKRCWFSMIKPLGSAIFLMILLVGIFSGWCTYFYWIWIDLWLSFWCTDICLCFSCCRCRKQIVMFFWILSLILRNSSWRCLLLKFGLIHWWVRWSTHLLLTHFISIRVGCIRDLFYLICFLRSGYLKLMLSLTYRGIRYCWRDLSATLTKWIRLRPFSKTSFADVHTLSCKIIG